MHVSSFILLNTPFVWLSHPFDRIKPDFEQLSVCLLKKQMIPYTKFIIRIPQLSSSTTLAEAWQSLLDSIRYASPMFYEQIKDLKYLDLENQPRAIQETIHKYFNRAKYRCTPLGKFASVGILNAEPIAESKIIINPERTLHQFIDWPAIGSLNLDTTVQDRKLFANSTYYQVGDEIRYVKRKGETFEMASISYLPIVLQILQFLSKPKPYKLLMDKIENSEPYIQPLIDCRLLITENAPNMIGQDYFARMGIENDINTKQYLISELTFKNPCISKKYFKHIPALIKLLANQASSESANTNLTDFTARFTQRFDRQNTPLMVALDPDIGVGYGDFHTVGISTIVRSLLIDKDEEKDGFAEHINNGLNEVYSQQTIRLDTLLKDSSDKPGKLPLPNSLSMICSLHDGQLFVKRIGGNSFNQLAGRFTLASESFRELSKEIATMEAEANPGVLFFDISYNSELTVDNVNRRCSIYPYELNILNYPGTTKTLTLEDIIVSVSGAGIILRSKKLGKRLVPRMASAYNYRRSKLPVFRFLYDLSFHGIIPDLSFDPSQLVKGRKYYPKVQFRNIILSQPKIKITQQEQTGPDPGQALIQLLKQVQIFPMVMILKGEEDTVFDLTSPIQLDLLLFEIRRNGELWLEPLPLADTSLFEDTDGKPYNNEMVIPLVHPEEIYGESSPIEPAYVEHRNFLPLDQWLYFEIYTAATFSNSVLLQVHDLIKQNAEIIEKWFFIRYNENGQHLRFRFLFKDDCQLQFFKTVCSALNPMLIAGTVTDIAIRTYNRELERYGVVGIENIENYFHLDSETTVSHICKGHDDLENYISCIRIFQRIKSLGCIEGKRYNSWINHIKKMFETEHNLGVNQFHQANRYFQEHRPEIVIGKECITEQEQLLADSIHQLLQSCPDRRRAPLLTDLMHMHINRLFPDHQRTHELIISTILSNLMKIPARIIR